MDLLRYDYEFGLLDGTKIGLNLSSSANMSQPGLRSGWAYTEYSVYVNGKKESTQTCPIPWNYSTLEAIVREKLEPRD